MTAQQSVVLAVRGMTCASCVRRVERVLTRVEGVETASVNLASETARVTLAGPVPIADLAAAISKAGYQAQEAQPNADRTAEKAADARHTRHLLAFGAVLAVPAIVISMGMDIAGIQVAGSRTLTGWLAMALATPVQAVLGWRYYRGGFISLRHLNPNMDVLVALGTSVAFFYSVWVVLAGRHEHMYFDVSTAVLVFITMGKYFEETAKGRASSAIRALLGLAAKSATVVRNGEETEVPVGDVRMGDTVVVRPGQRVPVDGVIRSGHLVIDESMLTGESIPVERSPGDRLIGGTVAQDGFAQIEASAVGEGAALARMAALVDEAQGSKAPVQHIVEQIAAVFVPVVVLLAVAVFVGWGTIGGDWRDGMIASVAVLVVACPCALGLATPTAIMVGTGMGAERGILIRNAEVLERSQALTAVVLDKTGTITEGRPVLSEIVTFGDWDESTVLALAASAESGSDHPLSRAIVDLADERGYSLSEVANFRSVTGRGITGEVNGHQILVGSRALAEGLQLQVLPQADEAVSDLHARGRSAIYVFIDGQSAAALGIFDDVKQNAHRAVSALKQRGLTVIMATGDNERAAAAVAERAGIDDFRAGVLPEDKLELVRDLQAAGHTVAMVGDGVNDAPALAQADVGIAMSTGTDAAMEAGDITLLHGDVSKVAEAITLGRSTLAGIKQNLVWAFGYNVLALPLAAAGLLNPIIAGGMMAFSSLSVMGNSLRLRTKARTIAESSGNTYGVSAESFMKANRGPVLAMAAAIAVLIVPLSFFTGVDRGWWFEGLSSSDDQVSSSVSPPNS